MKQIRKSVFETNSSSTHSLTICTKEEYTNWQNGKMKLDKWSQELVNIDDIPENESNKHQTYDEWCNNSYLEGYEEQYTTPSGDEIVVFGEYGYGG